MVKTSVKTFWMLILTVAIMLCTVGCKGEAGKTNTNQDVYKATSSAAENTLNVVSRKINYDLEEAEAVVQSESSCENKDSSAEESSVATEESSVTAGNSEESDEAESSETEDLYRVEESSGATAEETSQADVEACEHDWIPIYKTVYHDSEYEVIYHPTQWKLVHHDAVYETIHHDTRTETQLVPVLICNCGEVFRSSEALEAHFWEYGVTSLSTERDQNGYLIGINSHGEQVFVNPETLVYTHDSWSSGYEYEEVVINEPYDEQILVEEAWDEPVAEVEGWFENVLTKDAWTEEVLDHYECSKCGEWK